MDTIRDRLGQHAFEDLFIELLGWDPSVGRHIVTVQQHTFAFEQVAQKRGLQVFRCEVNHPTLVDQRLLQKAQKQLARKFREHIAIYSTGKPPRQVWQWTVRVADGRRLRHREHPFYSGEPPAAFVTQIENLQVSPADEEQLTLSDISDRVRQALDTPGELNLFARKPRYAHRSEALQQRIAAGDQSAFTELVLLHRPLARHISKRLRRWRWIDQDDAEQIAMTGLLQGVRGFRPEVGSQFATYAGYWIRQACQRYGPIVSLHIHIPKPALWPCFRFRHDFIRLVAAHGPSAARERAEALLQEDPELRRYWRRFVVATGVRSLSDRHEPEYRQARNLPDTAELPFDAAVRHETEQALHTALDSLPPQYSRILRLRYGLEDGHEHMLEDVAALVNVTAERVRQIQVIAEAKLARMLRRAGLDAEPKATIPRPAPAVSPPVTNGSPVPLRPTTRPLSLSGRSSW